ncbi:MAG: STAS domain-containing protein [Boseongicola sp.]|nr:STAS domain-containing protein [Boseongicola sp.]
MKMTTSSHNGALVITVEETRIDAAVAMRFKEMMKELTSQTSGQVVVDLSAVDFVDSSGLGAVVGSMKQLGRGRRMDLVGLSATVDKVFRMTRMDSVFRIFKTRDEATQETVHAS